MKHGLFIVAVALVLIATRLSFATAHERTGAGTISGFVSGTNRGDAHIAVYRRSLRDGFLVLTSACTTMSDETGRFACTQIASGDYIVALQEKGVLGPPRFYPFSDSSEDAEIIRLTPGDDVRLRMELRPRSSMPGEISLPQEVRTATIELYRLDGALHENIPIDLSGGRKEDRIILSVPAGAYSLQALWRRAEKPVYASADFNVDSGRRTTVTLKEWRYHAIRGRIHLSGASTRSQPPPTLQLIRRPFGTGRELRAKTSVDGVFEFRDVDPGEYVLTTASATSMSVMGVAVGGRPADPDRIIVDTLQHPPDLNVDMEDSTGYIEVQVDCRDGCSDSAKVLIESLQSGELQTAVLDAAGLCSFSHVKPGSYRLYAWRDAAGIAFRESAVLDRLRDWATVLTVNDVGVRTSLLPLDGR